MKRILFMVVIVIFSACAGQCDPVDHNLPVKGEEVVVERLLDLASAAGKQDIVVSLKTNLPQSSFVSDGCSGGFPDEINGISIYSACFWHDVRYWYGGPQAVKLKADATLMLDVLEKTGNPDLAVTMFNGVWIGGNLPAPWRWGFGR